MDLNHDQFSRFLLGVELAQAVDRVWVNGGDRYQMRTFGSTTRDLVSLREWLRSEGCTHVVGGDAGIGALIGALAGGGKGAAIGEVAGDGFGTPGRKPLPMVSKSNCLWKLC